MNEQYQIKKLSRDELMPLFEKYREDCFGSDHSYRLWDILSEKVNQKIRELRENMGKPLELYFGVFDKDGNFVGWSWGYQENATTYYMCNSAVLEAHRRKGLYQRLLDENISLLTNLGFQLIYSRHCATNNAVIIPKLKKGFVISKMELSDVFGVLIHLHYYPNKLRGKMMDYRSGQLSPDDEIKKVFKID